METEIVGPLEYSKITVWDLREFLKQFPDELAVVIAKDGEGNSFSPMAKGVRVGRLVPDDLFPGDFEEDDDNPSCVAFFPVG